MKKLLIITSILTIILTACGSQQPEVQKENNELPEHHILNQYIDLTTLEQITVKDNSEKRVLIFETEAGKKVYKSVYIKEKSRLKLIHLGEEGGNVERNYKWEKVSSRKLHP
ncbi:hypothetical protein SAMN04487943_11133 [Gracilibacillus orientalis]|uniref:Uncharacterized protein n=1 Tax=Gracilibacillus orientalis TaxID=334253 RepID=A0A1I4PF29_9BACI|nr:hypothetical protein [Gracilibacillus orientalis]SFM26297.1 hypothetical protein SAMN04487943_11133 [Gracilibacillus orientalis]